MSYFIILSGSNLRTPTSGEATSRQGKGPSGRPTGEEEQGSRGCGRRMGLGEGRRGEGGRRGNEETRG